MSRVAKDSVSATALSKMVVCEQQAYLESQGVKPGKLTPEQKRSLSHGDKVHAKHHRDVTRYQDSRCFIASAVYGPDAHQTNVLRSFRDQALMPRRIGRALTSVYYWMSPPLARLVSTRPRLKATAKKLLDRIVRAAEARNGSG